MQAGLAALGLLASIAAWLAGANLLVAVARAVLGSVIPFTLLVILPTNQQLLSPSVDARSGPIGPLLGRWGRLHAGRSVLGGLALVLYLYLSMFTGPR